MRILVTGASGLLGLNLAVEASHQHEVLGLLHRRQLDQAPFETLVADLRDPDAAAEVLDQAAPDWVVHCAATADPDACERDPALAQTLNAELPGRLAAAARARGIRLLHVSTDAVFNGAVGGYGEDDQPDPISVYGRSKLAGEQAVLAAAPTAIVARVNFYGWSLSGRRSLGEFFFNRLSAGEPVKGLTDRRSSPLLANDLAALLLEMLEQDLSGLYHVAAADSASKYDFAVHLAEIFGLDTNLIQAAQAADLGYAAPRAPDLSLSTTKLVQALGRPTPSVHDGLQRFHQLFEAGYPARLQAMQASIQQARVG